jgi:hypothetical protein
VRVRGFGVDGSSTWYARASESEMGKSCSENVWPPICFGLEFGGSGSELKLGEHG